MAIAMMGNAKVLLLDEPSTGMDPGSRRFLWNVISYVNHGQDQAYFSRHDQFEHAWPCSHSDHTLHGGA